MTITKKLYGRAAKAKKELLALSGDGYYTKEKELNAILCDLLNSLNADWRELSKKQVLHIISMCSSHRPTALHSILVSVSMQYDKIK
jgi:hypothetical protein